ncbi:MAG: Fur family transcriptional regulator [Pseudomonadota bacterium]
MSILANQHETPNEARRVRLTKNDRLVLSALEDADGPLKAYDLLERLKGEGIGAPMTVYRALDRLQKQGLVHKLDGLGAFVVCMHGEPHAIEAFQICQSCEKVEELRDLGPTLHQLVHDGSEFNQFNAEMVRIEVRGLCTNCNH